MKRYQVFISSTFTDLVEERKHVMQAVLGLNCFPAGMESFPASDAAAWDLIKKVIDVSDYYVLIVGARYGSVDDDGVSFTEREYDYAIARKVPILAFLHSNPGSIPCEKSDWDPEARKGLECFREKIRRMKLCKSWSTPQELGTVISQSLAWAIQEDPRPGWVRGEIAQSVSLKPELTEQKTEKKRILEPSKGEREILEFLLRCQGSDFAMSMTDGTNIIHGAHSAGRKFPHPGTPNRLRKLEEYGLINITRDYDFQWYFELTPKGERAREKFLAAKDGENIVL